MDFVSEKLMIHLEAAEDGRAQVVTWLKDHDSKAANRPVHLAPGDTIEVTVKVPLTGLPSLRERKFELFEPPDSSLEL